MNSGLVELAIVVITSAVLGVVAKMLRQPILLAYLVAGVLIGLLHLLGPAGQSTFELFSDLGIMFLLFLVGLEINYESLRFIGRKAALIGICQIALSFSLSWSLAHLLGFDARTAIYLGLAFSFASTVIVVKMLSEKGDLASLYGKISLGILLVQDCVAILALMVLTGLSTGQGVSIAAILLTVIKGVILFTAVLWLGRAILPLVFDRVARSPELLFLVSLAWLFLAGILVKGLGFSTGIAGFLAGLALANSAEHFEIEHRLRPLRDFFILGFFVSLGSSLVLANLAQVLWPILFFSLFVLVANPLILLTLMGLLGYRKRTSFFVGITLAQVSEFSFILIALGVRLGHLAPQTASLVTLTGMLTIAVSSYFTLHANGLLKRWSKFLSYFERKHPKEIGFTLGEFHKPIVLVGAHRTGQSLAFSLPKDDLLIIDFDPDVIQSMSHHGFSCLFGDVTDPEIMDKAHLREAKLVITTSPDLEDNLHILRTLRAMPKRPKIIVRAETESDTDTLYAEGADYVLLPHFTAGQYLGKTIAVDPSLGIIESLKRRDQETMRTQHG